MAYYAEEDEVYKCKKHPSSKQRRLVGVCPLCLTERLSALCTNCARLRPCSCSSSSSSSSASSTFSLHFSEDTLGPVSALMETEPSFSRRSAFPFFRSARFSSAANPAAEEEGRRSVWAVLWGRRSVREKMTRSMSVADGDGGVVATKKGKGWYFPSPMKVFRHVKPSKVVAHERSPMQRG